MDFICYIPPQIRRLYNFSSHTKTWWPHHCTAVRAKIHFQSEKWNESKVLLNCGFELWHACLLDKLLFNLMGIITAVVAAVCWSVTLASLSWCKHRLVQVATTTLTLILCEARAWVHARFSSDKHFRAFTGWRRPYAVTRWRDGSSLSGVV